MSMIYVRTLPGRLARVEPKGRYIPHDDFTPVHHTPYIDRLIHHHGDIEVRTGNKRAAAADPIIPLPAEPPMPVEPEPDAPVAIKAPPLKK